MFELPGPRVSVDVNAYDFFARYRNSVTSGIHADRDFYRNAVTCDWIIGDGGAYNGGGAWKHQKPKLDDRYGNRTDLLRGKSPGRLYERGHGTTGGTNNCVTGSSTISSGGVSFTRVLAIDASVSNVKTLTVTVSWSEGAIGTKSLTLKTVIAGS